MSNGWAIAAATATLRHLLGKGFKNDPPEPLLTVQPLDKARGNNSGDQVNLFLYHTQVDAAWRNQDMPRQSKPGETGRPPLPLTLFYILTAFDEKETQSYGVLGRAMRILHDHPVLDAAEIADATGSDVQESDLQEQIDRLRITLQPLSIEEMSKLWTSFQTQYRPSVAYQVSVVLIESKRSAKTPLPVLTRGKDDTGVSAQGDVTPPIPSFPVLTGITLPGKQPSVRLGEELTLTGHHLDGVSVSVRFRHPHLTSSPPVTIKDKKPDAIRIQLDDDLAKWVPGFFTVAVEIGTGADLQTTNELPLTVAPKITGLPVPPAPPLKVQRDAKHTAEIELTCRPHVEPEQRVALLLGDREISAEPHKTPTDKPKFVIPNAPLGDHFLRLRVDGVDSLLIDYPQDKPPVFDPAQRVTIHG